MHKPIGKYKQMSYLYQMKNLPSWHLYNKQVDLNDTFSGTQKHLNYGTKQDHSGSSPMNIENNLTGLNPDQVLVPRYFI